MQVSKHFRKYLDENGWGARVQVTTVRTPAHLKCNSKKFSIKQHKLLGACISFLCHRDGVEFRSCWRWRATTRLPLRSRTTCGIPSSAAASKRLHAHRAAARHSQPSCMQLRTPRLKVTTADVFVVVIIFSRIVCGTHGTFGVEPRLETSKGGRKARGINLPFANPRPTSPLPLTPRSADLEPFQV